MSDARWYLVQSPAYDYVEPILDDGTGPIMQTRDVAVVRARSAQEARWEASRLWERHGGRDCWPRVQRGDRRHPLTGVTTKRWDDIGDQPEADYEHPPEPDEDGWQPFYSDLTERDEREPV